VARNAWSGSRCPAQWVNRYCRSCRTTVLSGSRRVCWPKLCCSVCAAVPSRPVVTATPSSVNWTSDSAGMVRIVRVTGHGADAAGRAVAAQAGPGAATARAGAMTTTPLSAPASAARRGRVSLPVIGAHRRFGRLS
jgi:hypothetical protein